MCKSEWAWPVCGCGLSELVYVSPGLATPSSVTVQACKNISQNKYIILGRADQTIPKHQLGPRPCAWRVTHGEPEGRASAPVASFQLQAGPGPQANTGWVRGRQAPAVPQANTGWVSTPPPPIQHRLSDAFISSYASQHPTNQHASTGQ